MNRPPRSIRPPPSVVHADLFDLAGGAAALNRRAADHLAAGRPLPALHLVEVVLGQAPADTTALRLKLGAHEALLARSGRENFSEVRWLEASIRDLKAALAGPS